MKISKVIRGQVILPFQNRSFRQHRPLKISELKSFYSFKIDHFVNIAPIKIFEKFCCRANPLFFFENCNFWSDRPPKNAHPRPFFLFENRHFSSSRPHKNSKFIWKTPKCDDFQTGTHLTQWSRERVLILTSWVRTPWRQDFLPAQPSLCRYNRIAAESLLENCARARRAQSNSVKILCAPRISADRDSPDIAQPATKNEGPLTGSCWYSQKES